MSFLIPTPDIKTVHKGRVRNAKAVEAIKTIEALEELKKKSGSNPWPVIERILELWIAENPGNYQSLLYNIESVKETRADKKYGQSKTGSFRYTLDIPERVIYMLRMLYTADELPMNKQFFHEWANRFPKMKIAERM